MQNYCRLSNLFLLISCFLLFGAIRNASASSTTVEILTINVSDSSVTHYNDQDGCWDTNCPDYTGREYLWKADDAASQYFNSYTYTVSAEGTHPQTFTLTWDDTLNSIDTGFYQSLILCIKDGSVGGSYEVDLKKVGVDGWDGIDTLSIEGLFPIQGDYSVATICGDPGSNPVPEPATLFLFGVGLLGLGGAGRKKLKI